MQVKPKGMEREGDPEAEVALHHGSRHGELQRGGEEDEAEQQRRLYIFSCSKGALEHRSIGAIILF